MVKFCIQGPLSPQQFFFWANTCKHYLFWTTCFVAMIFNCSTSKMPQQQGAGSLRHTLQLGADTFKGVTAGSSASGLRSAFYGKIMGEVKLQRDLLNVQSPISGSTLTAANSQQHGIVRDPITGTPLRLSCGHAEIVTPVIRQEQVCADMDAPPHRLYNTGYWLVAVHLQALQSTTSSRAPWLLLSTHPAS